MVFIMEKTYYVDRISEYKKKLFSEWYSTLTDEQKMQYRNTQELKKKENERILRKFIELSSIIGNTTYFRDYIYIYIYILK